MEACWYISECLKQFFANSANEHVSFWCQSMNVMSNFGSNLTCNLHGFLACLIVSIHLTSISFQFISKFVGRSTITVNTFLEILLFDISRTACWDDSFELLNGSQITIMFSWQMFLDAVLLNLFLYVDLPLMKVISNFGSNSFNYF